MSKLIIPSGNGTIYRTDSTLDLATAQALPQGPFYAYEIQAVAAIDENTFFVATEGGLFKTTNGGTSYTTLSTDRHYALAYADGKLYTSSVKDSFTNPRSVIRKSVDGGASFETLYEHTNEQWVTQFAVTSSGTVYAGGLSTLQWIAFNSAGQIIIGPVTGTYLQTEDGTINTAGSTSPISFIAGANPNNSILVEEGQGINGKDRIIIVTAQSQVRYSNDGGETPFVYLSGSILTRGVNRYKSIFRINGNYYVGGRLSSGPRVWKSPSLSQSFVAKTFSTTAFDGFVTNLLQYNTDIYAFVNDNLEYEYYKSVNDGETFNQFESNILDLRANYALAPAAVAPSNTAPSDISLSLSSVSESAAVGSVVGTFSATDAEGGAMTYSLVAGDGSSGNANFVIVGNELRTAVALDYETQTSYSIRVSATDSANASYEKSFTVSVTNNSSDDPVALNPANVPALVSGRAVASVSVNPQTTEVTLDGQPLPVGSVVKNTATGQKFLKSPGGATDFVAIEPAPKTEWKWSQDGETAWAVLQDI